MTLLIVPIVGAIAMAAETGGWYYTQRSAQDAADSSALAAATNGCTTGTCGANYALEARATAARYGFVNGTNNATVTPTFPVTCPDGTNACYRVTITKVVPISLSRIVGFNGNAALGGGRGQTVIAVADARARVNAGFCVMTLGTSNNAFRINGGPNFNLGGCDVYSNGGANCNGSGTFGISSAVAVGSSDCGANPVSSAAAVADPYASLSTAANIPAASGCALTANAPTTINLSTSPCRSGALSIPAGQTTTLSGSGTLRIYNGNLVLGAGAKLVAPTSSGVTIVFTGTPLTAGGAPGFISGTGTIDISAPTTGTWAGVAVYQDARMSKQSPANAWDYSGNAPTFNITGLTYAPYADITFKGAINHATGGYSCMAVVSKTLTVSGTGSVFDNPTSQCQQAGLTLPNSPSTLARQALVQ